MLPLNRVVIGVAYDDAPIEQTRDIEATITPRSLGVISYRLAEDVGVGGV